jgi:hypothetical protein
MRNKNRNRSRNKSNNNATRPPEDLRPQGAPAVSNETEKRTNERHSSADYDCKEGAFRKITTVLSLVISAIVGGALFLVSYLQYGVYSQQAEIMQADQRPWVSIYQTVNEHPIPISPLLFDERDAAWHITIRWQIRNVSKTPAFHITTNIKAYVNESAFGADKELLSFCNGLKQNIEHPTGFSAILPSNDVLFPNNGIMAEHVLSFAKSDVEAMMKRTGREFFTIFPMTCVAYQTPELGATHATGSTYFFAVRSQPTGARAFNLEDKNVPAENIVFAPGSPSYAD